jgi:hypothetical protein
MQCERVAAAARQVGSLARQRVRGRCRPQADGWVWEVALVNRCSAQGMDTHGQDRGRGPPCCFAAGPGRGDRPLGSLGADVARGNSLRHDWDLDTVGPLPRVDRLAGDHWRRRLLGELKSDDCAERSIRTLKERRTPAAVPARLADALHAWSVTIEGIRDDVLPIHCLTSAPLGSERVQAEPFTGRRQQALLEWTDSRRRGGKLVAE